MPGRAASDGHRHLVIEENVTNENGLTVADSGSSSRNELDERSTGGGTGNRPRLRVIAGNMRVRSTALVRMASPR